MLPRGHVRSVLLDSSGGNDHRGLAVSDGVADFDPRQLLDPYRIECRDRAGHLELLE